MNFSCSQLENINISINYFNFIKEIFDDYIKYITNYRLITNEYIKKLKQLQENLSPRLTNKDYIDNIKFKNLNTNHIFSISSTIPKIVNKQIENLNIFIFGIESQINSYENFIKEKEILSSKFQIMFEESRKDLLKKYREIDKIKDNFMNNMSNTEDLVIKYLNHKDQITSENIKNSIILTKKLENEYKNIIKSTKFYENNFEIMYKSSNENIKKLSSETSSQMKDIIIDFIILLQNYIKMQSSDIDIYLPELNNLNEIETIEKIIEDSFRQENKLMQARLKKYKLKIFQKNNESYDNFNTNAILNLEDGYDEITFIKDETILITFKTMKENFELIEDHNMNIKMEEEKLKCSNLTEKVLSLEDKKDKKQDKNNEITNKDLEELNSLLDIHGNRVIFLQKLSEYRNTGKFELTTKTFDILSKLFNIIIDTVERDKDFHSVNNAIILSQTYYIKNNDDNSKKYLQKMIQDNKIFKSKKFWQDFLDFSISKEIINSINNDAKRGSNFKENRKESDDKKSNIAFAQILPFADNMFEFGVDKETIKEIIFPKISLYKINNESIETIKSLLDKK